MRLHQMPTMALPDGVNPFTVVKLKEGKHEGGANELLKSQGRGKATFVMLRHDIMDSDAYRSKSRLRVACSTK